MHNEKKQELIWVDEAFAKKYKQLTNDGTKDAIKLGILDKYVADLTSDFKDSYMHDIEELDDAVIVYKGLMLKAKTAFGKVKQEQYDACYELWENFEKELPDVKKKVEKITKCLEPFTNNLVEIHTLLNKIRLYDFDKLVETVEKVQSLSEENKEMFDFLMTNYRNKDEVPNDK